jgi:long-chain acyl-CoA synthetase
MFKELAREKFHSFPAVNTLFMAMANHADFNTVDWSSLKISVGGGMAVQSATAKQWLEKTGCAIIEGYGLSETSPVASTNPVDVNTYSGNIGVPMPNTDMKLLDDDGNEVHWASEARSPSKARKSWPATGNALMKQPRS